MSEANPSEIEVETQAHQVSWEEQFEDHENKIEEYIQNCIFRGGSVEGSIRRKAELQTLFRRIEIADATHPAGRRHLVVWDLLNSSRGSHYVSLITSSLLPRIYFAGPLFTQSEWQWNDKLSSELTQRGLEFILPQAMAYPMLKEEEEFDPAKLFTANISALEKADVVLAVLDQADPDSGTSWECGYAFKLGRPIIGVRTDIRGGGDVPGSSVNLMLIKSCTEFITLPPSQRDNVEWITSKIVEAVHRILKPPSND